MTAADEVAVAQDVRGHTEDVPVAGFVVADEGVGPPKKRGRTTDLRGNEDGDSEVADEAEEDVGDESGTHVDTELEGTPRKKNGNRPPTFGKVASTSKRRDRKSTKGSPEKNGEDDGKSDEEDLAFDPKGEAKVTPDGHLLGGRQYKVRTFTLPRRPNRLYMMTMDISKALGYRDSYLFYRENKHLRRINASEEDKQYLLDLEFLPSVLRTRPLGIMTARSVFVGFGHRIIQRGRPIRDDYVVGDVDESAIPDIDYDEEEENEQGAGGGTYDGAGRQVGMGGGTPLYSAITTTGPLLNGTPAEELLRAAASVAEFNSKLRAQRRETFFDVHTNVEQVPNYGVLEPSIEMNGKIAVREGDKEDWTAIRENDYLSKFPVALLPGQFQGLHSVYRTRFNDPEQPVVDLNTENAFMVDMHTRRLPTGHTHVPSFPIAPIYQPLQAQGTPNMHMMPMLPQHVGGLPQHMMIPPPGPGGVLAGMQNPMNMMFTPTGMMPHMQMQMQGHFTPRSTVPKDPAQRKNRDDAPVIHMDDTFVPEKFARDGYPNDGDLDAKEHPKRLHMLQTVFQTDMCAPPECRAYYKTAKYMKEDLPDIIRLVRKELDSGCGNKLMDHWRKLEGSKEGIGGWGDGKYKLVVLGALTIRVGAQIRDGDLRRLKEIAPTIVSRGNAGWPPVPHSGFRDPGRVQLLAALEGYRPGVPRSFLEPRSAKIATVMHTKKSATPRRSAALLTFEVVL
ncbi:hypothetical protein HK101_002716 [Irineochytrium annulatum]|nr:hypothetical protein HK101_002716 [Irineochytrium annulatum]